MSKATQKKPPNETFGMIFGLLIGIGVSIALNSIPIGIAIGIVVGTMASFYSKNRNLTKINRLISGRFIL